ncbi:MAG: hypothetical protein ACE5Z5_10565 [Candidatus Bathyarchaeia archaeon]
MATARYKRWKAKVTFQRTLIAGGVSPEAARELAKAYPDPLRGIRNIMSLRRDYTPDRIV